MTRPRKVVNVVPEAASVVEDVVTQALQLSVAQTTNNLMMTMEEELQREVNSIKENVKLQSSGFIKIKDKTFTLPSGETSQGPLTVVILDYVFRNNYFPGKYTPNIANNPVCWAQNKIEQSLAPDPNICPEPQATTCEECDLNKFGGNKEAKICKNTLVLAVVMANTPDSPILLLSVPPTSTRIARSFIRRVAETTGVPPIGVVTDIGFDMKCDYEKLTFSSPTGQSMVKNVHISDHWKLKPEAAIMLNALLSIKPQTTTPVQAPAIRGRFNRR
jgi:hypothetical protein